MITLWGPVAASAAMWKPSHTVLLISNPRVNSERRAMISLTAETHVEVDPDMRDVDWLRRYAKGLTKRDHVNQQLPEDSRRPIAGLRTDDTNILSV